MTFEDGQHEYRVTAGQVQVRLVGARMWVDCSRQSLLRFDVDSPLWDWLREQGITRPSPSGHTNEGDRPTVQVKLRLEPEIADRLAKLAERDGVTRSDYVTGLLLRAK